MAALLIKRQTCGCQEGGGRSGREGEGVGGTGSLGLVDTNYYI